MVLVAEAMAVRVKVEEPGGVTSVVNRETIATSAFRLPK